jgi:hypothetical protein
VVRKDGCWRMVGLRAMRSWRVQLVGLVLKIVSDEIIDRIHRSFIVNCLLFFKIACRR